MAGLHIFFDDSPIIQLGRIHLEHGHAMQHDDHSLFSLRLSREELSRGNARKEILRAEEASVERLVSEMDEFKEFAKWKSVLHKLKDRTDKSFFEIISPHMPELHELSSQMGVNKRRRDPFAGDMGHFLDSLLIERKGSDNISYLDSAIMEICPGNKTRGYQMMASLVEQEYQTRRGGKPGDLIKEILKDDFFLSQQIRQLYIEHLTYLQGKPKSKHDKSDAEIAALVDKYLAPDVTRQQKQAAIHQYLHKTLGIDNNALFEQLHVEIPSLSHAESMRRERMVKKVNALFERLEEEYPEYTKLLKAIGVDINLCRAIDSSHDHETLGRSVFGRKQMDLLQKNLVQGNEEKAYHTLLEEVTHYLDSYLGFSKSPVFGFPQGVEADCTHPPAAVALFMDRCQDGVIDRYTTGQIPTEDEGFKALPWEGRYRKHINQEWLVDIQAVERMLRGAETREDLMFGIITLPVPGIGQLTPRMANSVQDILQEYRFPLNEGDRDEIMSKLFPGTHQGLKNFRVEVERENIKLNTQQRVGEEEAPLHQAVAAGDESVKALLEQGISSASLDRLCDMVTQTPSLNIPVHATRGLFKGLSNPATTDPNSMVGYLDAAITTARIDDKTFPELAAVRMSEAAKREDYALAGKMRDFKKAIEAKAANGSGLNV